MLCPYCLRDASGPVCQHCKEPLPPLYIQRHGRFAKRPAILSAVGFSGHGKTVYLAAMLHALEKQLTRVWPKFYRQGLDTEAVRNVQENLVLLRNGELPESTRRNFPRPSGHILSSMPKYGTRDLLIYDPPGEAFDTDMGIERFAHFVQRAKAVMFLVSLVDLQEPKEVDLHRLLETYVLGMARMKANTRRQHLVITYTKADLLSSEFEDHPTVVDHLRNPDSRDLTNPRHYIKMLSSISNELAIYTEQELGARSFIHLAQRQFADTVYCAVSALGAPPEGGHLATAIEPRCVVDPLLWVLEKS
jgi:hypothetical protein